MPSRAFILVPLLVARDIANAMLAATRGIPNRKG